MKPLLIDFYGGPSSGKSTTALGLVALLKLYLDQYAGSTLRVEYVSEAAKDDVWTSGRLMLGNQARLLGEQYHRVWRLQGKVDIIVSDSPLWLCEFYGPPELYPRDEWRKVIRAHYAGVRVLPILIQRGARFEPVGRVQDEASAAEAHLAIADIARREYGASLLELRADPRTPYKVIKLLADRGDIAAEREDFSFADWYRLQIVGDYE